MIIMRPKFSIIPPDAVQARVASLRCLKTGATPHLGPLFFGSLDALSKERSFDKTR